MSGVRVKSFDEDLHTKPHMVTKRCFWKKTLHGIRSFHVSFHYFSKCFYLREMPTKASDVSSFYAF